MPIDLSSGNVHLEYPELNVTGKVELVWGRRFSNALIKRETAPLGGGWTNRYLATLTRHAGGFEFFGPEGAIEMLPERERAVERGELRTYLNAYIDLFMVGERYVVQRWNPDSNEVWRYIFEMRPDGQPMPLLAIEDVSGNGLDIERDDGGRLRKIWQRTERRTLILDYEASDRLSTVALQGPDGRTHPVARYEYDAHGRLAAAYDALERSDTFVYDANGRMSREVAKHGGVMTYRYDGQGRCVWQSGVDHYDEKRLRYLDAIRITEMTNSRGATYRYQWLPSGQITGEWHPLGGHTRTVYDTFGRIATKITPVGATTRYEYDERGNRSRIVNPLGNVFQLRFNEQHQPIELVDPNGQVWRRQYDARYRLVASIDPLGGLSRIEYDANGLAVALTNPKGDTRRCVYEDGVLARASDWMGQFTTLEFDAFGRLLTRTDPLGQTWRYTYDAVGNLVQTERPDGGKEIAVYSPAGDVVRAVDPEGRTTLRRYGPCRRLLQTVDANGVTVSFAWDSEPGFLESLTNDRGETYTFTYDDAGRCIEEVGFDGRRTQFSYDLAGQCIRTVNGAGETVDIARDALGAVVEQRLANGESFRFAYDKLGHLSAASNAATVVGFERDAMGRMVKETQGEHWVSYALDANGVTTRLQTDLGHRADYEIDANGLWTALKAGDAVFRFARDARTQERARRLPAPAVWAQRYDPVGQLAEQRLQSVADSVAEGGESGSIRSFSTGIERHYRRDRSGLVTSIDAGADGHTSYAYDPAEHLLGVSRSRGASERYEYDGSANITRIALEGIDGLSDEALKYAPGNVLVVKNGSRFEYDGQGRLARKTEDSNSAQPKVWTFGWNALDQLLSVTRPDGEVWRYTYDAFSRRIARQGPQETIKYVWSGHVPIHEKSSLDRGWTTHLFAQESFEPIGHIRNGHTYSVLADHLGTPQELLDNTGRIVWRSAAYAFGQPVDGTAPQPQAYPFHFPGHSFDPESGLYYSRYRYYDPDCGRFISQDPIRLLGGANAHFYAQNPIAWIDPWGLICQRLAGSLPEGPGIYHIELNGKIYTGSGVNVRGRLSSSDHPAAAMLNDPNVKVMVYPVNLGSAAGDPRMSNHVLRGFEQGVMDHPSINNTPQQNGSQNQIRAASPSRTGEYAQDAANNNASRGAPVPY